MWIVLGGYGQLGKSLGVVLSSRGIPHRLIGREDGNVTDLVGLRKVFKQTNASHIINCAAWTAVDDAEDNEPDAHLINSVGARNVAVAARDQNLTLVHISTDYVFSGSSNAPYVEDQAGEPVSAYGRTKLSGELAVKEEHPEKSYIVRTAWLYSEFGHNFVKTMINRALLGAPVRVVADQFGQPTLATDLAEHIVDLLNHNPPVGTYHGTNSGVTTWFELAQTIYGQLGQDLSLVTPVDTSEYPTRAKRPSYSVLSHDKTTHIGLPEMQNWKDALMTSLPSIVRNREN